MSVRYRISNTRAVVASACRAIYWERGIGRYPGLARAAKKITSLPARTYTDTYNHEVPTADHIAAPAVSHHNDAYIVATYPVDAHVQKSDLAFLYFQPRHKTLYTRRHLPMFLEAVWYSPFEDYIHASATIRDTVLYDCDALLERSYSFDADNGEIYIFWMGIPRFIEKMAAKNPRLRKKIFVWSAEQLSAPHWQSVRYIEPNHPTILTHAPSNLRFLPPGSIALPYRRDPREVAKLRAYSAGAFEYDVAVVSGGPRRENVLRTLAAKGIKTVHITDTYGDARDELIGKAKILLNVQFSGTYKIYSHIRCDRWMFAGKLIVSDECLDQDLLDVRANVLFAPRDRLVDKVEEVLADFDRFQREYTNKDLETIARARDADWHRFVDHCQFSLRGE